MGGTDILPGVVQPDTESLHQTRFLARQPIFDKKRNAVAYELLFRSGWENFFSGDPDDSTRQMLDNILIAGTESLSSNTLVFVKCTRESLVGNLAALLPPRRTVLQVSKSVDPDEEVVAACLALKKRGYRLALGGAFLRDETGPLARIADYIKVDFRASDRDSRRRTLATLGNSAAAFVAERVEDEAEFASALEEGFHYFQGYFFCKPAMLARREVQTHHPHYLRLLALLGQSPLDRSEVERIVVSDPPLCFRLLRLANSAIYGRRSEVRSVRRALVVMGDEDFRKLATIVVAGRLSPHRPHELLSLSLQRARLCELLAPHLHQDPGEQYLIGLFSLMDAILEIPMAAILDLIPFRLPVRAALLGEANFTSFPLAVARSFETGDWAHIGDSQEILALGSDHLNRMCFDATRWAEDALREAS
jgi:c-di-GMP phosphodiesterase